MPSHPTLRIRSPRAEGAIAPKFPNLVQVEEEVALMAIKLGSLFFLSGFILFLGAAAIGWLFGVGIAVILLLFAWVLYSGVHEWERRNGLLTSIELKVAAGEPITLEDLASENHLQTIYEEP